MPRPFDFRQDIADEILEQIKQGISLRKICASDAYPSREVVFKWVANNPDFQRAYHDAREAYADAVFDDCERIAEEATPETYQQARLMIDTRKWMLAKMRPKKYGDKLQVGGAEDLPPVRTQSTLSVEGMSVEELEVLQKALLGQNKENGNG